MKLRLLSALCLSIFVLAACATPPVTEPAVAPPVDVVPTQPSEPPEPTIAPANTEAPSDPTAVEMPMELTSVVFNHEQPIPAFHSCDGEDQSPPLDWVNPPEGTQSFALIMDDPDAPGGTWVHWVLYNIPAEARGLQGNIPPEAQLPDGSTHGTNSWMRIGYGGPCPPSGAHRYFFKLYALDTALSLTENADKQQVLAAIKGHVLADAELMGTYSR